MKTEKIFVSLFLVALTGKLLDIPGCVLFLIFTLTIISILYFPMAFYFFSDKSIKTQNLALSIIGGFVLAIASLGVLFKVLFWPGALAGQSLALILLPILLATCIVLQRKNDENLKTYYKNYVLRNFFWLVLTTITFSISDKQFLKIQHGNEPELLRLKIQSYENPDNEEYYIELQNYYRKKDSLEMLKEGMK